MIDTKPRAMLVLTKCQQSPVFVSTILGVWSHLTFMWILGIGTQILKFIQQMQLLTKASPEPHFLHFHVGPLVTN